MNSLLNESNWYYDRLFNSSQVHFSPVTLILYQLCPGKSSQIRFSYCQSTSPVQPSSAKWSQAQGKLNHAQFSLLQPTPVQSSSLAQFTPEFSCHRLNRHEKTSNALPSTAEISTLQALLCLFLPGSLVSLDKEVKGQRVCVVDKGL